MLLSLALVFGFLPYHIMSFCCQQLLSQLQAAVIRTSSINAYIYDRKSNYRPLLLRQLEDIALEQACFCAENHDDGILFHCPCVACF